MCWLHMTVAGLRRGPDGQADLSFPELSIYYLGQKANQNGEMWAGPPENASARMNGDVRGEPRDL